MNLNVWTSYLLYLYVWKSLLLKPEELSMRNPNPWKNIKELIKQFQEGGLCIPCISRLLNGVGF